MSEPIRIGLLGCGVVGGGVVKALANYQALRSRLGRSVEVRRIAVRDVERERSVDVPNSLLTTRWEDVVLDDETDIVVEVMGGLEPARSAIMAALTNGKDVVTANKELMAQEGEALQALAEEHGRTLLCEGSALGGVPAIHALHSYFVANQIRNLRGVVNGTCNYILSQMEGKGWTFADALADAQKLGYAEANPAMDVEGLDALYKFQILARLAFDVKLSPGDVDVSGIDEVSEEDIRFAGLLGCRIRHVVEGRWSEADGRVLASVRPQLVPADDPLYFVDGVDNFLSVEGDIVGRIGFSGPGAGALPTASAVVEDIVKVVQGAGFRLRSLRAAPASPVTYQHYLIRRRYHLGEAAGVEAGFGWRSDLAARQVKYLGTIGSDTEAWYLRGCDASVATCLSVVSSALDGEFAVYPASHVTGQVLGVRRADAPKQAPTLGSEAAG